MYQRGTVLCLLSLLCVFGVVHLRLASEICSLIRHDLTYRTNFPLLSHSSSPLVAPPIGRRAVLEGRLRYICLAGVSRYTHTHTRVCLPYLNLIYWVAAERKGRELTGTGAGESLP